VRATAAMGPHCGVKQRKTPDPMTTRKVESSGGRSPRPVEKRC
jgi:hypothetical protein